jgi:hypothetical protein
MKTPHARSNRNELLAAVNEVAKLKPTQIAEMIHERKIKGRPGTTGRCPLAMMMIGGHGGRFFVGEKYIARKIGHNSRPNIEKVKTPPNLAAFVRMFDHGDFSMLIAPPPRCRLKSWPNTQPKNPGQKRKRGEIRLHLARDVGRSTTVKSA